MFSLEIVKLPLTILQVTKDPTGQGEERQALSWGSATLCSATTLSYLYLPSLEMTADWPQSMVQAFLCRLSLTVMEYVPVMDSLRSKC